MVTRVWQYGNKIRCVGFKNPYNGKQAERGTSSATFAPDEVGELASCDSTARSADNICRARSRVRELAFCNSWEWFVTITLNPDKQDRTDLGRLKTRWNQALKDYAVKYGARPRYMMIPEHHKDGRAWHLHGLMSGLCPESMERNPNGYRDIPFFRRRFGWTSLSPIKDRERCASYVTKYITKDLGSVESGKHLFFASKGLNGATLLFQGDLMLPWSFENDYVKIYEGEDLEEILRKGKTE